MIAVPITAQNDTQALKDIVKANSVADIIELRLDFLEEVNDVILEELIVACKKPVIATFRDKNFGASVEDVERVYLLKRAIDFGAHFIDLDFDKDKDFFEELASQRAGCEIIVSHHNFDKTPLLEELLNILNQIVSLGMADVVKIVTTAKQEADNDTVLALVRAAKNQGTKIVAFCMGPIGKRSRVECLKMGASFTFASLKSGMESASGQIPIEEMRGLLK